jgi:hypothetical protein
MNIDKQFNSFYDFKRGYRMKISIYLFFFNAILLFVSCAEIDRFERIENDKLRIIGVRYDGAAEFAPGDTVSARVYFAGNTIASVGDFSIAYVHQYDKNDIFPDEKKIALLDTTLWFPDSMQFRYVIPEDVFLKEKVQGINDTTLLSQLYTIAKAVRLLGDSALPPVSEDTLNYLLSGIGSLYAQPSIFFFANSTNGATLKVKTDITIRYNSLFPHFLSINHNPQIKWIGIYKVPDKQAKDFYPHSPDFNANASVTYLYNEYSPESVSDTVVIDKGYTYFLACNQGIVFHTGNAGDTIRDTTCDFINFINLPGNSVRIPEENNYNWFFQNRDDLDEIKDSLMVLMYENSGPGYIQIKTPVFTDMTHFKVWVVVSDFISGFNSRPKGFAVGTGEGVFKFTEEYKKSVKQ